MPKPLLSKLVVQGAIGFFCVLFGCCYGVYAKDRIIFILSILIGICCAARTYSLYHMICSKSYCILEGKCIFRKPTLFCKSQQIIMLDSSEQEYCFILDKNVKIMKGHYYRLYFRVQNRHQTRTEIDSYQGFLCLEELQQ